MKPSECFIWKNYFQDYLWNLILIKLICYLVIQLKINQIVMFSSVEDIIFAKLRFQDLFLCHKYNNDIVYGNPNSTCDIRVQGKGVWNWYAWIIINYNYNYNR